MWVHSFALPAFNASTPCWWNERLTCANIVSIEEGVEEPSENKIECGIHPEMVRKDR